MQEINVTPTLVGQMVNYCAYSRAGDLTRRSGTIIGNLPMDAQTGSSIFLLETISGEAIQVRQEEIIEVIDINSLAGTYEYKVWNRKKDKKIVLDKTLYGWYNRHYII